VDRLPVEQERHAERNVDPRTKGDSPVGVAVTNQLLYVFAFSAQLAQTLRPISYLFAKRKELSFAALLKLALLFLAIT
jgi:hypothetical protein